MHPRVLSPEAWRIVRRLTADRWLEAWTLAGGTGLALQLGHRYSEDLDFFSSEAFETDRMIDRLSDVGSVSIQSRSAGRAGELATCLRGDLPAGVKIVEVPCAGSVSLDHLFAAFEKGADGVMVLTCHADNCHSQRGNIFARNRVNYLQELCSQIGLDAQRLEISTLASNMGGEFREVVEGFERLLVELGPSKIKK